MKLNPLADRVVLKSAEVELRNHQKRHYTYRQR